MERNDKIFDNRRELDEKLVNAIGDIGAEMWRLGCETIFVSFNDEGFINVDTRYPNSDPDGSAATFELSAEDVLKDAARAVREATRAIHNSAKEDKKLDFGLLMELNDACLSAQTSISASQGLNRFLAAILAGNEDEGRQGN